MEKNRKVLSNRKLIATLAFIVAGLTVPSLYGVLAGPARSQQRSYQSEQLQTERSLADRLTSKPIIRTDKQGYLAGETITITGEGFSPLESVMLHVAHDGGTQEADMGHEPWWVYADADGAFKSQWSLKSNDTAGVNLVLEADGSSGVKVAAAFARTGRISASRLSSGGQRARITAEGFAPKELVTLQIKDGRTVTPITVLSDQDGQVTTSFDLQDGTAANALSITAAAADSGLIVALSITTIPSNFFVVTDQQGANDQPGQVDLTQMGRDDTNTTKYKIMVAWDSIDQWTGTGQTGDACALIDSDGDANGNADYAACVRIANLNADPANVRIVPLAAGKPVFLWACNAKSKKNDRCAGPDAVAYNVGDILAGEVGTLSTNVSLITETDPFPTGTSYNKDSTVEMDILKSLIGGTNSRLTNVCSYPSAGNGGNNNPFDCIVTPGAGFLKIVKNAAGTSATFDFAVNPAPESPFTAAQSITTNSGTGQTASLVVLIGTNYSVTEGTLPTGWSFSTASCSIEGIAGTTGTLDSATRKVSSITIASGKITTCTFTNTAVQPKLTVTKVVVNGGGVTKQVSDFPLFVDTTGVTSGVQTSFSAGAHTVSETGQTGYSAAITGDCAANGNITLALGDVKSCTITNTAVPPKLTVTKVVQNTAGGTKVAGDFPLKVDTMSVTSGAQNTFNVGSHTVSETNQTGYTGVISGDCATDGSITLALGDVKSCTITNSDVQPKLTVTKVVNNDFGGTKVVADFPLKVGATGVTSGVQNGFNAGTYTVSETNQGGYTSVISGDCAANGSITLNVGDVKSCTITNSDSLASPGGTTVQRWVLHDKLTITDRRPGADNAASATVTFRLYKDGTCSTQEGSDETVTIGVNTEASTVLGVGVTVTGSYYWRAAFSGDHFNNGFTTLCTEITQIKAQDASHSDTLP